MSRIAAFPTTDGTTSYNGEINLRGEMHRLFHGSAQELPKSHKVLFRRARRDSNNKLISCSCVDELTREPDIDYNCPVCVKAGTKVLTEFGLRDIEFILPGTRVLAGSGQYKTVTTTSGKLHDGVMVKIDIEGRNNMPLETTDDHVVFVYRPSTICHKKRAYGKLCNVAFCKAPRTGHCSVDANTQHEIIIQEMRADKIVEGDYLVTPRRITSPINEETKLHIDWSKYRTKGSPRIELPQDIPIDEDLMFFFGWYVAEGSGDAPSRKTRTVIFSLNALQEQKIADKLLAIAKDKFGLIGYKKSNGSRLTVSIGHCLLSRWMHDVCGRYSDHKVIPHIVWSLSDSLQRTFLDAYIDGDGHVDAGSRVTTKSVSHQLSEEIYILAMSVGYFPTITHTPAHVDKTGQRHSDVWWVRWLISREVDSAEQLAKWRRRFFQDNFIFSRVNKTDKYSGIYAVYDLAIEHEHNFVADGVLVHNCGPYSDGYLWDEEWVDCRRMFVRPTSTGMVVREQYEGLGQFNVAAVIYWFEVGIIPTMADRVLEMAYDIEGAVKIPYVRDRMYQPDFITPFRGDYGRVEFYALYCMQKDSIDIGGL